MFIFVIIISYLFGAWAFRLSEKGNLDSFVQLVTEGMDSCRDIAEEMGVSKGAVSKWENRAETLGRIKIDANKRYLPVE